LQALNEQVPFRLLPLWDAALDLPYSVVVVVCGKYLTQASFECIGKYLESGGSVFFPFGLPQYDEQMRTHDWSLKCQPVRANREGCSLLKLEAGRGSVWTSSPVLTSGERLWEEITRSVNWITREASV
jgi:hypothetical protein